MFFTCLFVFIYSIQKSQQKQWTFFKFSLIKNLFLHKYLEYRPDCCVIDSFNNIYSVLDRLEIQENSTSLGGSQNWRPLYNQGPPFSEGLMSWWFFGYGIAVSSFFFPLSIQPWYSFKWKINWDLSVFVAICKDKSQLFNPWVIWIFEVILIMFNETRLKV